MAVRPPGCLDSSTGFGLKLSHILGDLVSPCSLYDDSGFARTSQIAKYQKGSDRSLQKCDGGNCLVMSLARTVPPELALN